MFINPFKWILLFSCQPNNFFNIFIFFISQLNNYDETGGIPITEFVGLRTKLYCYKKTLDEIKKAKGVSKHVIKKNLTMEEYKCSLINQETIYKKMYNIQSNKHELYTNLINKIALSGDDDKRVILQDRVHTLAIGHYKC